MLDPKPQFELSSPSTFNEYIRPGPLALIEIVISGKTATGETLSAEEVADTIQVDRDGTGIITEASDFFHELLQIPYGFVVGDMPTAGDTELAMYIPMFIPELPQVKEIGSDELYLNIDFNSGTLSTRFDADGYTVEITPCYADALTEDYGLRIERDVIEQSDEETYTGGNIAHLLFKEATVGSNDRVDVEVDNKTRVGSGADLSHLNRQSGLFNRIEEGSGLPDLVDYSFIQSGKARDALNGEVYVNLRGTSGEDVDVTRMRMEGAKKADLSLSRAQRDFQRRMGASPALDEQTRRAVNA